MELTFLLVLILALTSFSRHGVDGFLSSPRRHAPSIPSSQHAFQLRMAEEEEILGPLAAAAAQSQVSTEEEAKAATRTVNERLMEELKESTQKEKYGSRSSVGKKIGLEAFASSKTDKERRASIEEARDLNGVNPTVALMGSVVALAAAAGLWALTNHLAEYFAMNPIESDVYFVQRVSQVFRNIVMGLVSLASGFFGVTGVGIFLLGARVAVGVMKGELDPTPTEKSQKKLEEMEEMPNVWDLMMNKKPGRRR